MSLVLPSQAKVISNEKIDHNKVKMASKIIKELQSEMSSYTNNGSGPFVAAIYDEKGNHNVNVWHCCWKSFKKINYVTTQDE